ncbi:hypothetical protein AB0K08_04550 [Citricoccus sp. NPDC055426]|uniref:hypothetical protein n=1 Tax=Citricoccus sp. NPDC055426 TaxID=3155536 RepID=UPI00343CD0C8
MTVIAWLALANALLTAFAASFYMGLQLVVWMFLRPAWGFLTVDTLHGFFEVPISAATRFLKAMFVPFLVSGGLLVWSGWGYPLPVTFAWIAAGCYVFLVGWYATPIASVNTRLLSGDVTDDAEVQDLITEWNRRNALRVLVTVIYWLAAMGFLVSAVHLWEGLT